LPRLPFPPPDELVLFVVPVVPVTLLSTQVSLAGTVVITVDKEVDEVDTLDEVDIEVEVVEVVAFCGIVVDDVLVAF
jgi:hypothetical protein